MRASGLLDDAKVAAIRARTQDTVANAFRYARDSAYPQPAEALQHVFA